MINGFKLKSTIFLSVVMVIFLFFGFKEESLSIGNDREPTAIVVDVDTGKPIEGAVAIAIWRKKDLSKGTWFEGGAMVPVRIEEVVSDMEGKIYIDDFWDWHFFKGRYPHLTIYKPGYVCWDQELIYIAEYKWERRHDFDKENRIVRTKKWPKEFSFNGHEGFVDHCTAGDHREPSKKLFLKAFEFETPYRIYESDLIIKQKEELEKKGKEK